MSVEPLDLVGRHVVLDIVLQRARIRDSVRVCEVYLDTGSMLEDAIESIVTWIHDTEPPDLEPEVVTNIYDDCCITVGSVYPHLAASIRTSVRV